MEQDISVHIRELLAVNGNSSNTVPMLRFVPKWRTSSFDSSFLTLFFPGTVFNLYTPNQCCFSNTLQLQFSISVFCRLFFSCSSSYSIILQHVLVLVRYTRMCLLQYQFQYTKYELVFEVLQVVFILPKKNFMF